MKVYILCSGSGHYQGVFRLRVEAESYAESQEMLDWQIHTEVL